MQILTLILVGLLIGYLAKLLMPEDEPRRLVITILLGVAGSFVGAFVGSNLQVGMSWLTSLSLSALSAMLLLGIYGLVIKAATPTS